MSYDFDHWFGKGELPPAYTPMDTISFVAKLTIDPGTILPNSWYTILQNVIKKTNYVLNSSLHRGTD